MYVCVCVHAFVSGGVVYLYSKVTLQTSPEASFALFFLVARIDTEAKHSNLILELKREKKKPKSKCKERLQLSMRKEAFNSRWAAGD